MDCATLTPEEARLTAKPISSAREHDYAHIETSLKAMHAKLPPGAPVVVTGRLTLPAAWLLGRLLTRSRNVTCLQPRPQGQECDEFSLTGAQDGQGDKIVASRTSGLPKENDELNGVVVVAISSNVGQTVNAISCMHLLISAAYVVNSHCVSNARLRTRRNGR